MKPLRHTVLFLAACLFFHTAHTQPTVDSFFRSFRPFMAMHYSPHDLRKIKAWVDSTHTSNDKKVQVKSRLFSGKVVTTDGTFIDFWLYFSRLGRSGDDKLVGTIWVHGEKAIRSMDAYKPWFDSVWTEYDNAQHEAKLVFRFYKYSNPTGLVLEQAEPALSNLIKHEYFDFYFADLNPATSKWQREFRTFMQPYSETLIGLVKAKHIPAVFDLIQLKNKGFSWFLAEGLWYYNSLYPCLNEEQLGIVNSYNGRQGMIAFRPGAELAHIYNF